MTERVANLLGAAKDFIRKPGFVSHEEAARDLATCDACDRVSGHFCSVCGCWLKVAVTLKSKNCSLGKWARDKHSWMPHVAESWLNQTLVVVIHYGDAKLTRECVRDCLKEPVKVVVIDNDGSYPAVAKETVLRQKENIGWGAACNLAMKLAIEDEKINGLVILNNDIRLSPGFFSGLIVASRVMNAGIVAPCYNIGWAAQRSESGFARPAADYKPKPQHKLSGYCDGTAIFFSREVLEQVGEFDLSVAPQFGWGLVADFCVRAKQKGYLTAITEAAYVYHHGMKGAEKRYGDVGIYVAGARKEQSEGLNRRYGADLKRLLGAVSLNREIKTLNLLYHIWPTSGNDRWRWNVQQLLKRIAVFNGKRVVAIAVGKGTDSAQSVKDAFHGHDVEFIEKANDPKLREAATFVDLLERVKASDLSQATFYAHAKGVSRPDNEAEKHWAGLLYRELLDDPDRVRRSLATRGMLGVSFEFDTPWIYPGTFWWFHNASLFAKAGWRVLENPITHEGVGWSIEAFPNRFFADDCERIYPKFVYPSKDTRNIYDVNWWKIQPDHWERYMLDNALRVFDEERYLAKNPDVARDVKSGMWPTGRDHFLAHGYKEGRQPF